MLLSKKEKFIFIHIYKTAGTSVTNFFVPYCRLIDRMAYEFKLTSSLFGKVLSIMKWQDDGMKQFTGFRKHAKAYEIKNGIKDYNQYFKFAFVRNPYDLLASKYFFIQQSTIHKDHIKANELSFEEYIKYYISEKPSLQIDFLTDLESGEIIVDFIGRFETIGNDIEIIKRKLNLNSDKKLQHKNLSKYRSGRNYKDFYSSELKELVEVYFRKDFETLGYNFNGICNEIKYELK